MISNLENLKEKIGDVEVTFREEGCGGHAIHTIEGISESTIHSCDHEWDESDEDDRNAFKSLFPMWDGETEFYDTNFTVDSIEISTGKKLYAT